MNYSWEAITALLPTLSSSEHSKEICKREIESSKRVQKIKKLNLFYYSEESKQYLYDSYF
jgi:hypothetical protein